MGKPLLSPRKRGAISILRDQGLSVSEIARRLEISRCAVRYNLQKIEETGTYKDRARSGRKKKTSIREDRQLVRMSLANRRKTSSELAGDLNQTLANPISARTARRRLHSAGLRGCIARKKPWLSAKNIKRRFEWAKNHSHWTVDDWKRVIWSDESNMEVS